MLVISVQPEPFESITLFFFSTLVNGVSVNVGKLAAFIYTSTKRQ